jgi:hypothetical protein
MNKSDTEIRNLNSFADFSLGLGHFFSVLILYSVDRSPWTGDEPSRERYVHKTQNKSTLTSMCRVGFEISNPDFKRGDIIEALELISAREKFCVYI